MSTQITSKSHFYTYSLCSDSVVTSLLSQEQFLAHFSFFPEIRRKVELPVQWLQDQIENSIYCDLAVFFLLATVSWKGREEGDLGNVWKCILSCYTLCSLCTVCTFSVCVEYPNDLPHGQNVQYATVQTVFNTVSHNPMHLPQTSLVNFLIFFFFLGLTIPKSFIFFYNFFLYIQNGIKNSK